MKPYREFVGRLIDQGKRNTVILHAVLKADASGRIKMPVKVWSVLDKLNSLWQRMPRKGRLKTQSEFDQQPPYLFLDEMDQWWVALRQILQSPEFDEAGHKKNSLVAGVCKHVPFLGNLFLGDKRNNLIELGILDENGDWREEIFQKAVRIIDSVTGKETPNYERLRLWMHDLVDLSGSPIKRELPFRWMLCNDLMPPQHLDKALRMANMILATNGAETIKHAPIVKEVISAAQVS